MRMPANIGGHVVFAQEGLEPMAVFRMGIQAVALVPVSSVMVVGDRQDRFMSEHEDHWLGVFFQILL